jgi:Lar family restriction alleviation protein
MGIELKPCPFCGATVPYMESAYEDRMHGEAVVYNVQCQQCCASGPAQDSYYKAAKAWGDVSARHSRAEAAEARAAQAEAMYASTLGAWAQARAEGEAAGAARERAAVVAYLRAEARKMDPNHSGVYEGREGDADHMCGLAESIRDGEHVAPTDGGEQ